MSMLGRDRKQGIAETLDSVMADVQHLSISISDSLPDSQASPLSVPLTSNFISSVTTLPAGWNSLPQECLELIVEVLDDDTSSLVALLQVNRLCFFLVVPRLYRDPFQRIRDISRSKSYSIKLASRHEDSTTSNQHRFRESRLLKTLFSTLVHQLCIRFPILYHHFYPISHDQYKGMLDFGPYHRQVTWTSQLYLRHFVVIDLEKFCTRCRSAEKYDPFLRVFSPVWRCKEICSIGPLDYLQRALLNQPGPDRIQCLRIPMHRMRSYQQKHERAPRDRKKSKTDGSRKHRTHDQDLKTQDAGTSHPSKGLDSNSWSTCPLIVSGVIDESQRPYYFSFNKLTNLRRFEVFWVTENKCDWETLDRVLATLLLGNHNGISTTGKPEVGEKSKEEDKPLNQIREFSLQTQSRLDVRFQKILCYFKNLEVLELRANHFQCRTWLSNWDPKLCRNLKVLRMFWNENSANFEDLGRLTGLEELRMAANSPNQFQWIVDAKMKLSRCQEVRAMGQDSINGGRTVASAKMASKTNYDYNHLLHRCLPKLRKLGCYITDTNCQLLFNNIAEAFGDQIEELVLCASNARSAVRFEHPFRYLSRLALRGEYFVGFDCKSLVQHCPMVELLALQHTRYSRYVRVRPDDNDMVAALVDLKLLRCLYLEGTWYLNNEHFLKLVQESKSLYKIGVYRCDAVSLATLRKADEILCSRYSKYPLKPKGVYRIPNLNGDDFSWSITYFWHEDD
ncbi:hypothetical protein BGX20_010844 [Mortierella sp. AD010]|nr:hypothetical protein BGX20_010844 [Mortierella sp. AD010]